MDKTIFKNRLHEIANGDTNVKIAERIFIDPKRITYWCNDKYTEQPGIDDLIKLSKVYGCSIDYLVGVDSEPQHETVQSISRELDMLENRKDFLKRKLDTIFLSFIANLPADQLHVMAEEAQQMMQ